MESNTIFLRQKESSKNPQNTVLQFLREPVKYYNLVLINSFSAKFGQRFFGPKKPFPFSIWRAPLIASKYLNCFPGKQVPLEQKLTRLQFAASAKTFCRSDLSKLSFVHHPITPPRHFSHINSVKMEKPRLSCLSFNHHHTKQPRFGKCPFFTNWKMRFRQIQPQGHIDLLLKYASKNQEKVSEYCFCLC